MKYHFFKSYLGRLIIKSTSLNLNVTAVVLSSILLFSAAGSLQSSRSLVDAINRKIVSTPFGYIRLNINSNSLNYSTEIYFNSNASQGLDPGYDAAILGGSVPAFGIYSYLVQDDVGIPFAVQSLSNTDINNVVVPIGISVSQGQNITISITENDIPESINIYLEDRSNDTSTLLTSNAYNFTADTDFSGIGRFYLKFEGDALSATQYQLDGLQIYTNPSQNTILVAGRLFNETNFKLYDINGKIVSEQALNITSLTHSITSAYLNPGVYIVELVDKTNHKRTEKIIIQ